MINLLPPDGKKRFAREYWMRIAALCFFVAGGVASFIAVLLLPSYFQVSFQLQAFAIQKDMLEETRLVEQIAVEFNTANEVSDLLLRTPEYVDAEMIAAALMDLVDESVSVQSFQMTKNNGIIEEVAFRGMADDRAALVALRDRIQAHEYFEEVDLPISNLAKNENIPFSITIITAELVHERI